jgi:hypothetical protein
MTHLLFFKTHHFFFAVTHGIKIEENLNEKGNFKYFSETFGK